MFIVFPMYRIVYNVFPDSVQFIIVTDNVFVIIALPHHVCIRVLPEPLGHPDFKPANDGPYGFRFIPRPSQGRKFFRLNIVVHRYIIFRPYFSHRKMTMFLFQSGLFINYMYKEFN